MYVCGSKYYKMSKIAFNFYKIQFSKTEINLKFVKYESDEQLSELRAANPNLIYIRSKDNIYYWGKGLDSSNDTMVISSFENKYLFLNIVANGILEFFFSQPQKYKVKKKFHTYQITFLETDVLNSKYKGIKFFKKISLHFTTLFVDGKLKFGFTVSLSIKPKITWAKDDFIQNEVKYEDLDIKDEEFITNPKSISRIAKKYNYDIKGELDKQNAIQVEYKAINSFVKKFFIERLNEFVLPDNLMLTKIEATIFDLNKQEISYKNEILSIPNNFYYRGIYPNQQAAGYAQRYKIAYNKPFSFDEFENKKINIALIYPKHCYNSTANFFKSIEEELLKTFKIKKENFTYTKYVIDDFELKSYQKILSSVREADVVIVVVDEAHEVLDVDKSPYYFCKSKFIERGICTQELQIQQIDKFLADKKTKITNYTDHNLALNIYAKLGGIGWTIKPNTPKNELIIGIGATTDDLGQPILGIANIFRGDGKYLFGSANAVSGMDDYMRYLEESLTNTIVDYINNGILETNKTFYLIFHLYKSAGKENEIKALGNIVKKFSAYDFEYAFIHIGDGHNYRFFHFELNENIEKFEEKKGLGQNKRGSFIIINEELGFLGLSKDSSTFLKMEIDYRSSFIDIDYIAKQVYQFTEMSHTSYNKSSRPVTIKYPNLMAFFAEKLKEVNGHYLDEISMPNNSLWFI